MKLAFNFGLYYVECIGRKSGWVYNNTYALWSELIRKWKYHTDYYDFLGSELNEPLKLLKI